MTSSGSVGDGPSRNRQGVRLGAASLIVVVAVLALVLLLHGGGGGGGPLNAVAQAAEATQEEPGGHMAMHAVMTTPKGTVVKMAGRMIFEGNGRGAGSIRFRNPNSSHLETMQMVADRTAIYISSSLFGTLPGGSKWMKLDLPTGGERPAQLPAGGDGTEGLKLLESAEGIEEVGKAHVRGVTTTQYRGKLPNSNPESSPLGIEAWIDQGGKVRRVRLVGSRAPGQKRGSTDMTIDYFDFGPVPSIEVPKSSEVFDGTSLAG